MSLVSVDSTTVQAHHDAAGMHLGGYVMAALEKAAEEEKARQEGAARRNETGGTPQTTPSAKNDTASDIGAGSG